VTLPDDPQVVSQAPERTVSGERGIPGDEGAGGDGRRQERRPPIDKMRRAPGVEEMRRRVNTATAQRGDAERLADAAIHRAVTAEAALKAERRARLTGEQTSAEQLLTDATARNATALEAGDGKSAAAAQADVSKATARLEALRHQIAALDVTGNDGAGEPDGDKGDRGANGQRPRQSEAVQAWVAENNWFTKDQRLHDAAVGFHHVLKARGIRPESDEYFRELQREMWNAFPDDMERYGAPAAEEEDDEGRNREGVMDREQRGQERQQQRQQPRRPEEPNARSQVRNEGARGGEITIKVTDVEAQIARSAGVHPHEWGLRKAFRTGQIDEPTLNRELQKFRSSNRK
jgi:hypothetical protein